MTGTQSHLREVSYAKIKPLAIEVVETGAFVTRRDDDIPFVLSLDEWEGLPGVHFFLVEGENGEPAGFTSLLPPEGEESSDVVIGPTYLSPAFRGRGWGKSMLREVIGWATQGGARCFSSQTWGRNVVMRAIFEDLGFHLLKEILDARINGDSTVFYMMEIRA